MSNIHTEPLARARNSGIVYAYAFGTCTSIFDRLERKGTTKHQALELYRELQKAVQARLGELFAEFETPIPSAPVAVPGPVPSAIYEPEETVSSRDESSGEQ